MFPSHRNTKHVMSIISCGQSSSPALLQSTEKLLFCPTKALLRPGPRLSTLLASESVGQGMALWVKLLLDARNAGSTVRVDVSLALVTFTSLEPKRSKKKKDRCDHFHKTSVC